MFLVVFKSSNPRSFSKLKLKLVGDPLEWDSWDAYSQSAEIIFQIKKNILTLLQLSFFSVFTLIQPIFYSFFTNNTAEHRCIFKNRKF